MADLYLKPSDIIDTGYNPEGQQAQQGVNKDVEEYLNSLPLEERDAARQRLFAPPTGEELAMKVGQDRTYLPTLQEYEQIEKWQKTKEVELFEGLGASAETVFNEFAAAAGSFWEDPVKGTTQLPASVIEAFMQGTRAMYGMAAQSQNPDSAFFRVKDIVSGTGTLESRYNQYLEALEFNRRSMDLMEGKETILMDKDLINPEVTQAMSYIADPTLFIPFGKAASAGMRAVGMGEKLTLAAGRAAAIKNGIIGNTIKWGAGQPLEFLGGAVRNTIDFGLEKAGDLFETATGMGAKEFAQTARMSGIGVSTAGIAGHAIPYATAVSDAYFAGSAARGFGEALTAIGDTMKRSPFERGINSWAKEALEKTPNLSPQAQKLLKVLDAVDPMFAYSYAIAEGAAQGAVIGGGLGYLSGGEEGLYQGMGAGLALGTMGAGVGRTVAGLTGGVDVQRRAVQAKMVIEGHRVTNPEKAMFFEAMQKAAEAKGQDVDLVNGIIAGIDRVAPNFEFHALTPDQFETLAVQKGYNPSTGKFTEKSSQGFEVFGDNRASKGRTLAFMRLLGGRFAGRAEEFIALAKDTKFKTSLDTRITEQFNRLDTFEKQFVIDELNRQKQLIDSGEMKPEKFRAKYDNIAWAESWTDQINKIFEQDSQRAFKEVTDMLAQERNAKGELSERGKALADKLRADGYLDKDFNVLRKRNLHMMDLTLGVFDKIKGAVVSREADGKTHMYINLKNMGDETFPHELFHTIFRESELKHQFVDSWIKKLVGTFDENGVLIRKGEVSSGELKKFFRKYIEATSFDKDGNTNRTLADERIKAMDEALAEYESIGDTKKISDKTRELLEQYTEEFGAYYFSHWLMGRNRNTLFYGGDLRGIAGIMESVKDSFLDFWQSKISKNDPTLEFDGQKGEINRAFNRSGKFGRVSALDYWMRDMVRAEANSNRGSFNPDSMSPENLREFSRSNGLRNLSDSNGRALTESQRKAASRRQGKEAFKVLDGLDPALRTSQTVLDTDGKPVITGRLSEAELDALVKGGIVPRAWADKVSQGYAMLDGTIPNTASFGYLGRTEQIGDYSWPRKTGKDVAFKNRKAIIFDVETKVYADGRFYTLFHTLDKGVIEVRANKEWQKAEVRNAWNNDRGAMEADFFAYLSNASKASTDTTKLDSATLLEKGDGLGAFRRDVLHQMAGMALQQGDTYRHKPIAAIPEGINHAVTTFNVDGMTNMRIERERYTFDHNNAHKFIRENWQPDDMRQEKTPNGMAFTHASGYKFLRTDDGKVSAYSNDGSRIGTFGSLKEATDKARSTYNKVLENTRKTAQKMQEYDRNRSTSFQPIGKDTVDEAFEKGDLFKTARIQQIVGNSKLVRQSFDEFLGQRIEEISKGKDEAERGAILSQLFNEDFKELIELEKELQKNLDEFSLEARTLQAQEQEIISRIVEFGQEKKRLQQFSDPDARVDVGILEMYERIYKRKEEVVRRMSEISNKMHNEGITDANSHYYIVKRFLEKFNETGKLSDEAIKFVLTPRLIKEYESQFQTGQPVSFVANHGTPNYELMASRTFNTEFLGRNTGSMSAFNATFFAGSKETSVNYVGNPIKMSWVRDFIDARSFFVEKLPIDVRVKIERLLESDTSKGVVQKVKLLMNNLAKEFPDDFKLVDSSQRTKDGEIIYKPSPTTQRGYYIDSLVDKILEGANDEGWAIGGYEMYWEQAGRKPNLLRTLVKMDNPYVHEYAKADYRDETFASVIQRAKEAGHDGVIFKNTKDGGGIDTIFASFAKNEDNKIFVIETTEDTRFAPRGTDESGRVYKGGSEIEGRSFQPIDEESGKEYGGVHKAPSGKYGEGSLDAMDKTYPSDLYSSVGARYYGSGMPDLDNKAHKLIMNLRGKPDALVTVYRAVPKGVSSSINKGDWVTPLREYAVAHGERWEEGMTIIEKKVKASELYTEGNSLFEFGYSPKQEGKEPKFQPDEGGRTYSEQEMAGKFIGRYAAENPNIIKGKSVMFTKDQEAGLNGGQTYRLSIGNKNEKSGYINVEVDESGKSASVEYTKVNILKQGKGYGNLLYSEMVERLRSLGVEEFSGMIVDESGRPQKIRKRIIDKENLRVGGRETEVLARREDESGYSQTDIVSYLDKKAWYEPDDKDKAPVNWVKSGLGTEGYNMDVVWMKPSRFLNLAFPFLGDYKDKAGRPNIESLKKKMQSGSGMDRIYLRVDLKKGTKSFKVIGHEGRHRATAAMELFGDDKLIPVEIDYNSEHLKEINRGDYDYKLPEGKKLAGSISRMVKENKPMWNEKGTAKFQPDEVKLKQAAEKAFGMPIIEDATIAGLSSKKGYEGKFKSKSLLRGTFDSYRELRDESEARLNNYGWKLQNGEKVFDRNQYERERSNYEEKRNKFLKYIQEKGGLEKVSVLDIVKGKLSEYGIDRNTNWFSPEGRVLTVDELFSKYEAEFNRELQENKRYKKLYEEARAELDASPLETTFQTGKPVAVKAFHGTPYGEIKGNTFAQEMLGKYTKAASAKNAYFFAGSEKTSNAYVHGVRTRYFDADVPYDGWIELDYRERDAVENAIVELYDVYKQGGGRSSLDSYAQSFINDKYQFRELVNATLGIERFSTEKTKKGKVFPFFIKFDNPLVFDQGGEAYREKSYFDLIEQAKKEGRDGVIILDTKDGGEYDIIYAVLPSYEGNIKLAKTRTYDDQGRQIPLSQRFDTTNKDIRFQPEELELINITRTQDVPWFRNLISDPSSYVRYVDVEELNSLRGLYAVSHGADTLTGVDVMTDKGRRVVEGKGGLGYALNPSNEAGWASIGSAFVKLINDTVKLNLEDKDIGQKTAILPLVFTTYRKNLNSVQGSEAFYNFFEILRRGKIVSDTDLRLAMADAVVKTYKDKKGNIKQSQTDTLKMLVSDTRMNWDEMLSGILLTLDKSSIQNFGTRGRMVDDFFGAVWNRLNLSEAKQKKIKSVFPEWTTVSSGRNITVEDIKTNVANITTDTLSRNLKNGDVYAILKFNDFVTTTESNHRSYDTGVVQENGKKPEVFILKKPISINDFYHSSVTSKGERVLSDISDRKVVTNLLGMNARPYGQAKVKPKEIADFRSLSTKFQPAEWSDFKTEQSPMGKILKNAKGYSIMLINNKYRVYNPAKAIIGVYGNEEEAKRRVLRDAPKQ